MTATLGRTVVCGFCARGACDRCPGTLDQHGHACSCTHQTAEAAGNSPDEARPAPAASTAGAGPADPRTLALRLIALRVLKDTVGEADATVRQQTQAGMLVGDRVTAALGAEVIGHVQLTKGRGGSVSAVVEDEAALLAWVTEHHPDEVVTTRSVRRSFLTHLLDTVRAEGVYVDKRSGEAMDLPGVSLSSSADSPPTLAVKPTAGAAEAVRQAWRDGTLTLTDLTAITDGGAA